MRQENRRAVRSWYLYDWGNSAFYTCITTAFLPFYYLTHFVDNQNVDIPLFSGIWHTSGIALWSYSSAVSMFLVIIVAPVLGAIADMSRGKKRFLCFCVITGAIATAAIINGEKRRISSLLFTLYHD